ncbi:DUF4373 domain-containing protein [Faecalispora sporosphaeroides]|uniref:DUF4373 domain-containing protein n=1 Tax=Faecalispora sporosphaeroides TaxID=1549 RepID=UPI00036DBB75|nr:DUF4373 domain-containing protein [Faecalispora sporosphaeroides]
MGNDPRIMLLIDQLGPEGYGILLMLDDTAQQHPESCRLELIPALAREYNTTAAKIETVIRQYGFFDIAGDGRFSLRSDMPWRRKKRSKPKLPAGGAVSVLAEYTGPPFIYLTLNDKSEYPVYPEQVREWAALYPAVNVEQELRNMKGWCTANPSKRKTGSGILRFITSWLAKEQNKGGSRGPANKVVSGSSAAPTYDLEAYEHMSFAALPGSGKETL